MKTVFRNNMVEVIVNESTNEVHIIALKTEEHNFSKSSLRISVDPGGFDLTSNLTEYIPKSFNGLPGFRIKTTNNKYKLI